MKLSEVFDQLAYGELSQLALVDEVTGKLDTLKYPQMVSHVNLGLTALYKRFYLKSGRVGVSLVPGVTIYALDSTGDATLIDVEGEFADDVLKIEAVETAEGVELPLNNATEDYNCVTPSAIVLRVPADLVNKDASLPADLVTDSLVVGYRANHPVIVYSSTFNPSNVLLELPVSHLEALLLFIASRIHNPIGMTNEFHAGNSYAAKYEKACELLEMKNLQVDQGNQNTGISRGGWV